MGLAVGLLLGVPAVATAGPSHVGANGGFSVAISYTPSPTDPLLLTFSATVVPGTPTAFSWNFGDGHFANGSGPAYADPVHRYAGPGTFNVSVVAFEGNVSASQFLPLSLVPSALSVSILSQSQGGVAPFLDMFSATINGGSGTYPSVLWEFGDGGNGSGLVIRYTFERAGTFDVRLNVTDSSGHYATAVVAVNVTGAAASSPTGGASEALALAAVAAAAIGGTAVGALLVGRWLGRREEPEPPSSPAREPAPAPAAVPEVAALAPDVGPGTEPAPPAPRPAAGSPTASAAPAGPPAAAPDVVPAGTSAEPAVVAASAAAAPDPSSTAPGREALRLSQRIVLHLAGLGTLGSDEVATLGFTQLGMSAALGTRQNALTNVLRRLVAAGILLEDVRHVRGQPRRLKVYRLTPRGEALARELRATRRAPTPTR